MDDVGTTSSVFLEVAEATARNLCARASDDGHGGYLWRIPNLASGAGGDVPTGPYLYRGTAGIALFLMRLCLRSPRPEYLNVARRALRAALRLEAAQDKACGGFYNGTGGLIAALTEMYRLDGDVRWLQSACALGDKLLRGTRFAGGFDLITGDGGSLLGLLHLHDALEQDGRAAGLLGEGTVYLDGAHRLGERLLIQARKEPDGLSWDGMHPQVVRNIVGMSHGAGGVGLALLELFKHGGEPRFLVGALQALRYEDSLPGAEEGRWPDFRHDRLMRFLERSDEDALRRALQEGTFGGTPSPRAKMAVWCHGAPGIALVRAHFLRITGDAHWATGLRVAAERTLEVVASHTPVSHSLCHGRCGNADILLELGRQCGVSAWADAAIDVARRGLDEVVAHHKAWKSGYRDEVPAPGLLLGDAGIGLFYLRCADASVPGCLTPATPRMQTVRRVDAQRTLHAVGKAYVDHLPRTRAAMETLGERWESLDIESSDHLLLHVEMYLESLAARSESEGTAADLAKLRSVYAVEAEAFRLLCRHRDFTAPYLEGLRRQGIDVRAPNWQLELPSTSRLVTVDHHLGTLLEDPAAGLDTVTRQPSTYLLYERDHRIHLRCLDALTTALYRTLGRPMEPAQVVHQMTEYLALQGLLDIEDADARRAVEVRLWRTLQQAVDAGMIRAAGHLPSKEPGQPSRDSAAYPVSEPSQGRTAGSRA